ncbi:uncharacterized protein LOC113499956 [Trichoplusia ni]|uniref:Uncharacterized protein LOC113499956 n=1 Tax=Trichoplusia ni TaxID=7111 RepID=A0A7E5W6X1_TRINI|nr:uncharacterized protein LOC113499956 [Trichoplusia ni]
MAPVKFGLFKARSREYQEQPSTENLLYTSNSSDHLGTPSSPVPSTSKCLPENTAELAEVHNDSEEDELSQKIAPTRRISECSRLEDSQMNYQPLKNQASTDATSVSTLNSDEEDQEKTAIDDDASTTCDVLSLQFDETSIAASEDLSVYCGTLKKTKKLRIKEEKQLRDFDMWQASNVEVMQRLLSKSGTLDEQIKWEAIATARGLCILKDSCTCDDCTRAKYLAGVTDGDGGLGAAPLFSAISVGCIVQ